MKFKISELRNLNPELFLAETEFLDFYNPDFKKMVGSHVSGLKTKKEIAIKLFNYVRDNVRYTMFANYFSRDSFKASKIINFESGFCVQKAVLLAAMLRCALIPAGLIFADIVNFLAPPEAIEVLGTDIFSFHGYVCLFLNKKWLKVTPTFDRETCRKTGYPIVSFNGRRDAVFPPETGDGRKFVFYKKVHGIYTDLPIDEIYENWVKVYGKNRLKLWSSLF